MKMNLAFFPLTLAILVFNNHYKTTAALDTYLTLTVSNADEDCESGWFYGHAPPCNNKAWLVKHSHRIMLQKITEHGTSDIYLCIEHCIKTGDCVAATVEKQNHRCHLAKKGYENHANNLNWASMEAICCKIKPIKKLSTNSHHNLPIIFNIYTDCEPGTVEVTCAKHQKVWHLRESFGQENSMATYGYMRRLECLNKCIDNDQCASVNDNNDWNEHCKFNAEGKINKIWKEFNSLTLKCCEIKNKELWKDRKRNLPILYDPTKLCASHQPVLGQNCEVKIWTAIEGVVMDSPFQTEDFIADLKMTMCLNYCLKIKGCVAVAMREYLCYFYYKDAKINYGHIWFTLYRLTCCTLK